MRIAGWAPRRLARLFRQLLVAESWVYPGKAKNSMDTLRREGSMEAAEVGGDAGTAMENATAAYKTLGSKCSMRILDALAITDNMTRYMYMDQPSQKTGHMA